MLYPAAAFNCPPPLHSGRNQPAGSTAMGVCNLRAMSSHSRPCCSHTSLSSAALAKGRAVRREAALVTGPMPSTHLPSLSLPSFPRFYSAPDSLCCWPSAKAALLLGGVSRMHLHLTGASNPEASHGSYCLAVTGISSSPSLYQQQYVIHLSNSVIYHLTSLAR